MKTCPVCDTPYPDQHATCPTDGAVLIESRELDPGHIVRGKYRIVRTLGAGGMGVVYLAEHLMLGGQLALKFLAAELSRNPQLIKRFRQEARAAYQLRHPNIVEVTDLDQDEDGNLFIAMEFVLGPSLRGVLHRAPRGLPVLRALGIARGVAAGLVVAHSRGIVHRDIKPENILIGKLADGEDQAKVLDFGIAAMAESITNVSHTRGLLLTPEYAAPEQWRGTPAAELDGRTDLYALGGILYEMLTGQTPFHAHNTEGWMYQHLQGVPEPLGKLRPDLVRDNPKLVALVMRLLAREREQRPASASEFLAELDRPERRQTVVEPPKPLPPKPEFISVVEPEPEPEPIPQRPRRMMGVWLAVGVVVAALVAAFVVVPALQQPEVLAAQPYLDPSPGTYDTPQAVSIGDTTQGAEIHYTTDGSQPTESSPVYSQPLDSLPSGATVRAIAALQGRVASTDISGVYTWSGKSKAPTPQPGTGSYQQAKDAYDRKQYAQARTLFDQACYGGDMPSCNYLGYMYAQGQGGSQSAEKAAKIYLKACNQGIMLSCAGLGSLYQDNGENDNARKYFQKACDGKLPAGCELLHALQ